MSVTLRDWYDVLQGSDEILQGDLLRDFPVLVAAGSDTEPTEGDEIEGDIVKVNLVVLSQSCDIANDKIESVILGEVLTWSRVVEREMGRGNTYVGSQKFRKKLVAGEIPNLALLRRRESEPSMEWSVVNFHNLHVQTKEAVARVARKRGQRLRLKSPYREYLSQSLGRYFMRVALPSDCRDFIGNDWDS